ncbi:hypothetical protein SY88_21010 [Clostridiales bacterium PH28_bin88]|nr:hypothetical protein SY88_21010 [Clostridiales bacterium PH28_bin88]
MLEERQHLNIQEHLLENGSRVVDAGIHVAGSWEAGKGFAEICLGGMGQVSFQAIDYGDFWLPGLTVAVNRPVEGCLASQYAGWSLQQEDFFAMASGPARSLAAREELFQAISYREADDCAVLALEGRQMPSARVAGYIAEKCGVEPRHLWLVIAPTASLAGAVQVSARVVETGLHKLKELGFDVHRVRSGFGTCPVAPVAGDDGLAIGRTNDCVLYGGQVYYTVAAEDGEIEKVIRRMPSAAAADYGTPFYQILKRYNWDFYRIDPLLFSPARVVINNVNTGRVFQAGGINREVLRQSLLGG